MDGWKGGDGDGLERGEIRVKGSLESVRESPCESEIEMLGGRRMSILSSRIGGHRVEEEKQKTKLFTFRKGLSCKAQYVMLMRNIPIVHDSSFSFSSSAVGTLSLVSHILAYLILNKAEDTFPFSGALPPLSSASPLSYVYLD
jgi:hypothetical protein